MESTIERISATEVKLTVTVPKETIDEKVEEKLKEYRRKLTIPGFRRGKVPMSHLRSTLGDQASNEVRDALIGETYKAAVEENQLIPLEQGEISDIQGEPGEPLVYTANVIVEPDVEITNYKDFKVEFKPLEFTEESVETSLAKIQRDYSSWVPKEGEAVNDDRLILDLQETDSLGIDIPGAKYTGVQVVLGAATYGPAFDEQMLGVKAGEVRQVTVPADESDPDSQTEYFKVTVNEIKEVQLLDLDDNFAKEVPPGFDTLEDLKTRIREDLAKHYESENHRLGNDVIIQKLIDLNPVDPPQQMVDQQLTSLVERTKANTSNPVDEDIIRKEYQSTMENSVRWYLLRKSLINVADLAVDDPDIDSEIDRRAKETEQDPVTLRIQLMSDKNRDELLSQLQEKKIFSFLREHCEFVEPIADNGSSSESEDNESTQEAE